MRMISSFWKISKSGATVARADSLTSYAPPARLNRYPRIIDAGGCEILKVLRLTGRPTPNIEHNALKKRDSQGRAQARPQDPVHDRAQPSAHVPGGCKSDLGLQVLPETTSFPWD